MLKRNPTSLREAELKTFLDVWGVEEGVVIGAMSHMCIDATSRAAFDVGCSVSVAQDACATRDLKFEGKIIPAADGHAAFMDALGFVYGGVVTTAEIFDS